MLLSVSVVLFYAALYLYDRRAGLHRHMRRGLGYAAVVLGAFIFSFFFFYGLSPVAGMTPTIRAAGGGICLVVAAYYLHRLTVLHRDYCDEEEAAQQQAQVLFA
ncbi:hypothetical protein U9M48_037539 [Paspalum notatum var. saurae]|uniref:Uncharacterized protein n=1 Tax=Paspalum notatum var. saurae TaxID=547442 RepID=A0AAQ3UJX9_PASNO